MTVTIVTGGGSGIGAALCRRLAVPGARVLIHTGRRREVAEALAADLATTGAETLVVVEDFLVPSRAEAVVAAAVERWGHVDRIVHAAGFADRRPIGTLDAAGLEASLAANVTAFFHLVTAALPSLRLSPAPRIVAIGSFLADRVRFGPGMLFPATSASKAALAGLVRALAMQLAPERIPVNAVIPGFIAKNPAQHSALDADSGAVLRHWSRSAGMANRTRWRRQSCFCSAPTPLSSRVNLCTSTAGSHYDSCRNLDTLIFS